MRTGQLLLLPAGLVVGHLLSSAAAGHGEIPLAGGRWSTQALVCVGVPLAMWTALTAFRDGWGGRDRGAGPRALVIQQVAAFVGVDLVEHAFTATSPWTTVQTGRFWVTLAAHAAGGALVWIALRMAHRAGRELARLRTAPSAARCFEHVVTLRRQGHVAAIVALSSLSRRGPPAVVPAPQI